MFLRVAVFLILTFGAMAWSLDPYPGFIELAGWEGGRLKVHSDRPPATCDASGWAFGYETSGPSVPFLIDVESGEITQE